MKVLYFLTYIVLVVISFVIFYIFRPYTFIDHEKTRIICLKDKTSYIIGPSFIYAFDQQLDPQTDKNVRKLCEYKIINDYQDTYKNPESVNYKLDIRLEKQGSWGDVILLVAAILIFVIYPLEKLKTNFAANQKKIIVVISFLTGFLIFSVIFKQPAAKIYCERQSASRINNFKRSAYGFGLARIQKEEPSMRSVLKNFYNQCLQKEGIKM